MSQLDHEKLDVYRRALRLLEACDRVVELLPPGRSHVRNQVDRAAGSVVANIAEGAGELRPKEKARFYRMARRSATEVAAWLDIIGLRREVPKPLVQAAAEQVKDLVPMLVKLIRSCER
jgi:four helix bundle protein